MWYKRRTRQISTIAELLVSFLLITALLLGLAPPSPLLARTPATAESVVTPLEQADTPAADHACARLQTLALSTPVASSLAADPQENAWYHFTVRANARYRLAVEGGEGLELRLHNRCNTAAPATSLHHGRLEFTAVQDGDLYLHVKHGDVTAAALTGFQVMLSPAPPHRANAQPLADVPQDVLRRATEFLEELRGSDLAPAWQDARINPEARIFYRPDIQEAAYYEVTVEKPVGDGYESAGFIQLSTGEHDYVVTNWDMEGMSPTEELAELAPLTARLTEFYRLNTLSYVAEYEELTAIGITTVATDVIQLGDLPVQIEGLDALPEEPAELVTESIDSEGNTEYEGPTELPLLEQSGWDSWAALKEGYGEEYAPLLKSLKERASHEWTLEQNLQEYGESLTQGEVRTIVGLAGKTVANISVTGDGADPAYLQQDLQREGETLTGLILTVLDEPADADTRWTFDVQVAYADETTETLKYAIVNADALETDQVFLPLTASEAAEQLAAAGLQAGAAASGWGPWSYWWSGGDIGSMRYGQFGYKGCASGCGATAWSTVFGWVDRRAAAGAGIWTNHWGIYRVDGGLGANAVAPLNEDNGVRNMTREINDRIRTYCCGSGGCTRVTDMIRAADYVRPRATAAWVMRTRYDSTGLCWFGSCNPARYMARDQIIYRQAPAILAANNHYPIAHGYAQRSKRSCFLWFCSTTYSRWFWVNNGWYGNNNGWVNWDDVFFAGTYTYQ